MGMNLMQGNDSKILLQPGCGDHFLQGPRLVDALYTYPAFT
jgi:hypothetical protein